MAKKLLISLFAACLVFRASSGFCLDDGFGSAKKVQGQHFTLMYAPQVDFSGLSMSLDFRPADMLSSGGSTSGSLTDMLDSLFTKVCDIMDMQLYSYQGTIKVCRDAEQLNSVYRVIFGRDLTLSSFYVNDLNTIYIDQQHFTQWVLGHEMSHAIQCHYFVVPPPVKVSEVLAGYVEYQLRKR